MTTPPNRTARTCKASHSSINDYMRNILVLLVRARVKSSTNTNPICYQASQAPSRQYYP